MNRKWIAVLLTLVLAVVAPMQAFAGMQHVLTLIPGEELASEPVVADVMEAAAFKLTTGEKSGALTLMLNGKDMATIALGADKDGLYVESDLLSEDVLFVSWDDGIAFVTDLLKQSMEAEDALDENTAQMLDTAMTEMKASILLAMETGMQPQTTVNPEEGIAVIEKMFPDDPGMVEYIKSVYENMKVEEGEFTSETRDTANGKYVMSMDNEDLLAVCDTNYMRSMVEQIVLSENAELAGEALTEQVDAVLEQVREVYRNTDMNMDMTMYTADEGQTLVGMDMVMNMAVEENGETANVSMNMNYGRLTTESGVNYRANLDMKLGDTSMMDMVFKLKSDNDGASKGILAALADGEQITFLYEGADNGPVRERSIELYARSGAEAIIEPAASERPLITICLATQKADPARLADIDAATGETAVNVLGLSDAEMAELMNDIQSHVQQVAANLLGNLPGSVMQLLMQ